MRSATTGRPLFVAGTCVMAKRKALTPKTRFEVFKRDSFKCQYCGKSAPEIILEVDHINPVSKGGGNEVLNLITSCWDCNRGKSNRVVSDKTVINKQVEQLAELQERRNQLDMLMQWKNGLIGNSEFEVNKVIEYFEKLTNYDLGEIWIKKMKFLVKKYGVSSVIDSIEESYNLYYDPSYEKDNLSFVLNKLNSICLKKTLSPEKRDISDRVGVVIKKVKNRFHEDFEYKEVVIAIKRFMYAYDDDISALEDITTSSDTYREWKGEMYA